MWWNKPRKGWQNAFNSYGNSNIFIVADWNSVLRGAIWVEITCKSILGLHLSSVGKSAIFNLWCLPWGQKSCDYCTKLVAILCKEVFETSAIWLPNNSEDSNEFCYHISVLTSISQFYSFTTFVSSNPGGKEWKKTGKEL